MKVALFDVDRTGWPNLALMKLSAWHKAQGDTVLPLNTFGEADKSYASCVGPWFIGAIKGSLYHPAPADTQEKP